MDNVFVNPHPKTSTEHWKVEAERRNIVLLPEDDKLAEIRAKVAKFDEENPNFFGEKVKVEQTLKIKLPAGVRFKGVRLLEEIEVEILEKDWDKYSHVAEKI